MRNFYQYLIEFLKQFEHLQSVSKYLAEGITFISIIIIAFIAAYITRKILLRLVNKIAKKTKTNWDDILVEKKFFRALVHIVPAMIIYHAHNFAYPPTHIPYDKLTTDQIEAFSVYYSFGLGGFILRMTRIYFTSIILYAFNSLVNASVDIYNTMPYSHNRSIKGYAQLLKIFVFFLGGIVIVAALLDRDPTWLITGLGAMAAVLLLIFKDTILGFVASIQLSANDMLKIGDWIEMPGHRADGTVLDITLNTVKVQNWDMTITTIPTYALVSESFNNWKGMEESGGRRIKRSINIDMKSVKFCTPDMLDRFHKFSLIKDYVIEKEQELEEYNRKNNYNQEDSISRKQQTNLGIFRKYLETYLEKHPQIHDDMTFLVRHLQPSDKGLPIEIYVFSKDQRWANYEAIQADIMDHIVAVIPEFELNVFQAPSGSDFQNLLVKN
ncbi:mechanosensitive ion channel [Puteibacter caeruleilacunae]|nr:mechanosensitive ion channel [Puteibacter caeruleilacunae]